MKPSFQVIQVYAGATLRTTFLFLDSAGDPVPLSARSARMQAREDVGSPEVKLELSSDDGTIVLGDDGTCQLLLDAEATAALSEGIYDTQTWVFDLEIVTPGATPVVDRVLTGNVIVHPEITR